MKHILVLLLCGLAALTARAEILLNEPFAYANGALTNVSGGVWATHSGTGGQLDVTNGAAFLTSGETEDVNAPLVGQPYVASNATNIFYARFTVRAAALPTAGGAWFAGFKDGSATGFRCRAFALTTNAAAGTFRLGLSTANNTTATVTNLVDLATNVAHTVVLRLVNSNSVAQLWVNPSTETSPSVTTAEAESAFTVAAFALRQNTGMGTLLVDDLVVATTFVEALNGTAVPTPPTISGQPVSLVVTQGSNANFTVSASGSAPLNYQWWFADAPLADATNAALNLTNVQAAQAGNYFVVVSNSVGFTNSDVAELTVFIPPPPPPPAPPLTPALSVLTYNSHGNQDPNWTTNNSQVRAIGRIVAYLNPDIVTFQEIPMTNNGWANMPNIISNYLPGYFLATNSGTDGFIRSAIASRYPILRSQSWLDGVPLLPFGNTNNFTRDLFEAEVAVPDFDLPVHVFTAHLKSGTSASADAARRAAEAGAISNFLVNSFLPTYSNRLYVLTGDLNEDIARPATGSQQPIQRLTSTPTGLRLTTPTNPITGQELTFSIQSTNGLTRRYDYILPSGTLFSNVASNLVFRSDLLTNFPPNLFSNDVRTASDHLPVMMWFANPYPRPFRLLSLTNNGTQFTLRWETMSNRIYGIEASTNLVAWQSLASNLTATGTNLTFTTNLDGAQQFFRISRRP